MLDFNDYARFEKSRVIRIFLSSPFQGLEQEREEFSKLYLPKLKHKCGKHGVNLYVVDLRWGITEEVIESFFFFQKIKERKRKKEKERKKKKKKNYQMKNIFF